MAREEQWNPKSTKSRQHNKIIFSLLTYGFLWGWIFFVVLSRLSELSLVETPPTSTYVLIGIDLILAVFFADALYEFISMHWYRLDELLFLKFPFYLGEKLEVAFIPNRNIYRARTMSIVLRCKEKQASSEREVWSKTTVLERLGELRGSLATVPILIPLPQGPYETVLEGSLNRFWELEIKLDSNWIDYDQSFLIPVMRRS